MGSDDEVGSLNYLDAAEIMRGLSHVRKGEVFTLGIHMGHEQGDPVWPGRSGIKRENILDEGTWDADGAPAFPGGLHYADDTATLFRRGVALPLHCTLMRNLGAALTEIVGLDKLAASCAADGHWSFLYVAAPLKIVKGTGAPVNPVVIR